jgi:glycerol-3-phosphate dehydrogenase
MEHEYAQAAEDVVWRRSNLGLRMDSKQIATLQDCITEDAEK